jgi:hypothetical protein
MAASSLRRCPTRLMPRSFRSSAVTSAISRRRLRCRETPARIAATRDRGARLRCPSSPPPTPSPPCSLYLSARPRWHANAQRRVPPAKVTRAWRGRAEIITEHYEPERWPGPRERRLGSTTAGSRPGESVSLTPVSRPSATSN